MVPEARKVKVALAQATPLLFDPLGSARKTADLTLQAGALGARLVLFPEAFIPAYPRGAGFGTIVGSRSQEGRELYLRLWNTAVDIPGPVTETLASAARDAGIYLAIGVLERERNCNGTLFCSILLFGPDGRLLWKHRKLRPTGSERLIWGEGDGSSLVTVNTAMGRVGGLICWENYMPLARAALYAQGIEIYLAPTADARDTWQSTVRHIACEGRCYVLACNQYVTKADYPGWWSELEDLGRLPEVPCRGGSVVVSPLGEVVTGPVYDREALLFAELDLEETIRAKLDFDPTGHYSRSDVFELSVNRRSRESVRFISRESTEPASPNSSEDQGQE